MSFPKDQVKSAVARALTGQPNLFHFADIEDISDDDFLALQSQTLEECLTKTGHKSRGDGIFETPSQYDPFTVNMGQLTIYRYVQIYIVLYSRNFY